MKRSIQITICVLVFLAVFALVFILGSNNLPGNTNETTNATEDINYIPWENGGKAPNEYTWEEFEALSGIQQEAFVESFESAEAFNNWEKENNPEASESIESTSQVLPWENGGKAPNEYTWEEFEALSGIQQEAFADSFDSPEDFEAWENSALSDNQ